MSSCGPLAVVAAEARFEISLDRVAAGRVARAGDGFGDVVLAVVCFPVAIVVSLVAVVVAPPPGGAIAHLKLPQADVALLPVRRHDGFQRDGAGAAALASLSVDEVFRVPVAAGAVAAGTVAALGKPARGAAVQPAGSGADQARRGIRSAVEVGQDPPGGSQPEPRRGPTRGRRRPMRRRCRGGGSGGRKGGSRPRDPRGEEGGRRSGAFRTTLLDVALALDDRVVRVGASRVFVVVVDPAAARSVPLPIDGGLFLLSIDRASRIRRRRSDVLLVPGSRTRLFVAVRRGRGSDRERAIRLGRDGPPLDVVVPFFAFPYVAGIVLVGWNSRLQPNCGIVSDFVLVLAFLFDGDNDPLGQDGLRSRSGGRRLGGQDAVVAGLAFLVPGRPSVVLSPLVLVVSRRRLAPVAGEPSHQTGDVGGARALAPGVPPPIVAQSPPRTRRGGRSGGGVAGSRLRRARRGGVEGQTHPPDAVPLLLPLRLVGAVPLPIATLLAFATFVRLFSLLLFHDEPQQQRPLDLPLSFLQLPPFLDAISRPPPRVLALFEHLAIPRPPSATSLVFVVFVADPMTDLGLAVVDAEAHVQDHQHREEDGHADGPSLVVGIFVLVGRFVERLGLIGLVGGGRLGVVPRAGAGGRVVAVLGEEGGGGGGRAVAVGSDGRIGDDGGGRVLGVGALVEQEGQAPHGFRCSPWQMAVLAFDAIDCCPLPLFFDILQMRRRTQRRSYRRDGRRDAEVQFRSQLRSLQVGNYEEGR
ncbi:hypothetical protein ACHAWF_007793 [Thalassiosira exigua]